MIKEIITTRTCKGIASRTGVFYFALSYTVIKFFENEQFLRVYLHLENLH